jgi:hypothetical protein
MAKTFEEFKRIFEMRTEWSPDLPTPIKGGEGPRFALEINVPVTEHIASAPLDYQPRSKANTAARPTIRVAAEPLPINAEAFKRLATFAIDREAARLRKEAGEPWPWSPDPIINNGVFCNVRRADDAGTRYITTNIVEPHRDDPDLPFALILARCCNNEPKALAEIGWPVPFDAASYRAKVEALHASGATTHRSYAYRPAMPPRELAGISYAEFHTDYILGPMWRDREKLRPQSGETLESYSARLQEYERIGPFLAAQVIADLKHAGPLRSASDRDTFVEPGPGSLAGLNRLCKRPVNASWSAPLWRATLLQLPAMLAPHLQAVGISQYDGQDCQHLCCEFNKYMRAVEAGGVAKKNRWAVAAKRAKPKEPEQRQTKATAPVVATLVASEAADTASMTMASPPLAPAMDDEPDHHEAAQFLTLLDPQAASFTFQTFDDIKDRKNPALARILHGNLDQHFATLSQLNARGAGIFVTINETDGRGRTNANIVRVRRVFLDLDSGAPVPQSPLPHIVVSSSPGKWQVYWRTSAIELAQFSQLQTVIAQRFGGDKAAKDLARVLRLPGFFHRKGEPVRVRIHAVNNDAPICSPPDFTESDMLRRAKEHAGLGINDSEAPSTWAALNALALANLDQWVPALFGDAAVFQPGTESYRVSSKALGRELQEDLSIHPSGIKDWGVHDLGDPRQGKRTPIDVVMEFRQLDKTAAFRWLDARLHGSAGDPNGPTTIAPADIKIQAEADFVGDWRPPDYLIEGVIQRRFIYALTGQTGHAKTAIALRIAKAVDTLNAFLAGHQVDHGRVAYLVGENPDDVRARVIGENAVAGNTAGNILFVPGVFNTDALLDKAATLGALDLLIVDTSAAYFLGEEENSNTEYGNHARKLRRLIDLPGGPCVLVLCHPTKYASEPTQLLPRGGGAFLAEIDGNLTVWKEEDRLAILHHSDKMRGPGFEPITFRLETVRVEQLHDSKGRLIPTVRAVPISEEDERAEADTARSDEDALLIARLHGPADMSMADLAKALNWVSASGQLLKAKVQRVLNRLAKEKLVKLERKRWVLTDKGQKAAKAEKGNA